MQKTALTTMLLLVVACGGKSSHGTTSEQTRTTATGDEAPHQHTDCACEACTCPMAVPGTRVSYEDTPDGASVFFSTSDASNVTELQTRVAKKAEYHSRPDSQTPMKVPHLTRSEDVTNGARLIMIPNNPADLEALRTHVREHVEKMQAGHCPMMEDGDQHKHHHHSHEGHDDHHMHEHPGTPTQQQ